MKSISTLLKVKKEMFIAISMVISANGNISSKKRDLSFLSSTKKETITILKLSSFEASIF